MGGRSARLGVPVFGEHSAICQEGIGVLSLNNMLLGAPVWGRHSASLGALGGGGTQYHLDLVAQWWEDTQLDSVSWYWGSTQQFSRKGLVFSL